MASYASEQGGSLFPFCLGDAAAFGGHYAGMERPIYRAIEQEAQRLVCAVLAVNGMADYVHLLVKSPTRLSPAKIMAQIKGVSSVFANAQIFGQDGFRWQEGYGVFSVGRNQRAGVIAYIKDQKTHHATQDIQPDWEETDEEYTS